MASKSHSGEPSPVLQSTVPTTAGRHQSDEEPTRGERQPAAATRAPQQANADSPTGNDLQDTAAELQDQWTDAIHRNMRVPEGYAQAAVLIVKWALHLDDLKCLEEVVELDKLFRERFHYKTVVVSLDEKAPHYQLIQAISGFLREFDGPNNLLIIYYTGHSAYNTKTEELEFYARNRPLKIRGDAQNSQPSTSWNFAESLLLRGTQADTLAILDTCFASNVNKGGAYSGRAYQLLAASGPDRPTAAPGPKSFTTALIQVLNEWLDEDHQRMTLWGLSSRINEKVYRRQNPCFVQDRLKQHDRLIYLAPLKKDKDAREKKERALSHKTGVTDLTLRFGLGVKSLNREQIEILTKELPKACKAADVKLQRIDWVSFEERPPSFKNAVNAFSYAQHWLRETRRRRNHSVQGQLEVSQSDTHENQPYTKPASTTITTGVINMKSENTESVNVHADTAVIENSVPSSSERQKRDNDRSDNGRSLPLATHNPLQGENVMSVHIGNMAPLTWAVVGMGVLSCATTIICNWRTLRA